MTKKMRRGSRKLTKLRILSISLFLLTALMSGAEKRWTEMTDKEQYNVLQDTLKLYDELDAKYQSLKTYTSTLETSNIELTEKAKKYNRFKITTQGMFLIDYELQLHVPLGIGFEYRPYRYFSFGGMVHYDPVYRAAGFSVLASVVF